MKATLRPNNMFRKAIVHSIVGLMVLIILFPLSSNNKWDFYAGITFAIGFYIHSLIFLPILTQKKNLKRYLILTFTSLFIFTYVMLWFEAVKSSQITIQYDGSQLTPSDFFFQSKWLFLGAFSGLLIFIPFSLFSFLYHVLILDKVQRKNLFTYKYIELIINGIVVVSLLLFSLVNARDLLNDGIRHVSETLLFVAFFYTNTFLFVPKLLRNKSIIKYGAAIILLIGIHFLGQFLIHGEVFIEGIQQSHNQIPFLFSFLFIILLSFIYAYARAKIKANEQLFNLRLNAKDTELQLLKSQVNPHFLFNSLNTLYATSLKEKAPKTAQSIAKLASLIRYMQNDIHKEFIPLQTELNYVKDYIEIQKLRMAESPEIVLSFQNIDKEIISPGIFIPLVENAFKYGILPNEKSRIHIKVRCESNTIHFLCENTYDKNQKVYHKEEGFGIGIKNVVERLKLVYPKKHHFDIHKTDNIFTVELMLQ